MWGSQLWGWGAVEDPICRVVWSDGVVAPWPPGIRGALMLAVSNCCAVNKKRHGIFRGSALLIKEALLAQDNKSLGLAKVLHLKSSPAVLRAPTDLLFPLKT